MKTKKQNYNKALKLINKIQNIRKKNNVNWMDVLRLAFKHDPKNAAKNYVKCLHRRPKSK